jgi:hypothetical protein
MPRATTPRRVKRRDHGPRTCHHRNTTHRSVVSQVKSICCGLADSRRILREDVPFCIVQGPYHDGRDPSSRVESM